MIVYMLLNTVTEKVYVGSAVYDDPSLKFEKHLEKAAGGKATKLYDALRTWPAQLWETLVLEHVTSSVDELVAAEERWIQYCCARDDNVGYNVNATSEADVLSRSDKSREQAVINGALAVEKYGVEFYRECGKRWIQDPDVAVANGKKGAAASAVQKASLTPEALAEREASRKAKHATWWSSLTEEEKEAHREAARVGGKLGGVRR